MKKTIYTKPEFMYWEAQILDSITAQMSGGSGEYTEIGHSQHNPLLLTQGISRSIHYNNAWFQCEIDGATDFFITGNEEFNVKVYNGKIMPFNIIGEWNSADGIVAEYLSNYAINSEINLYRINVTSDTDITILCKVEQHVDKYENQNGALWKSNNDSAIPYGSRANKCFRWYVPKEHIPVLIYYLDTAGLETIESNSQILRSAGNEAASMAVTMAAEYIAEGLGGAIVGTTVGIIASIFLFIAEILLEEDFGDHISGKVFEKSGFDLTEKTHRNGVVIKKDYLSRTSSTGVTTVDAWDGEKMTGAPGWTGTFDIRHLEIIYNSN